MKNSTWAWFAVALLAGAGASAQTTTRVSVSSSGTQASGIAQAISADGRFVAFQSTSSHVVPNDTNTNPDVFLRDRQSGTTECVSVNAAGTLGNAQSLAASISADDRYVADFEKLLSEVTKSGKDRAAGTAYLTSDTGKVYTMLAHASGRFD